MASSFYEFWKCQILVTALMLPQGYLGYVTYSFSLVLGLTAWKGWCDDMQTGVLFQFLTSVLEQDTKVVVAPVGQNNVCLAAPLPQVPMGV